MSHRPRKRFGQNFLHDPGVIQRIIQVIAPRPGQHLVEIGPGQGALSADLYHLTGRLDVVEIDRDLVAALQQQYATTEGLHIHQADALSFDFCSLAESGSDKLRIVGNLPYNISTPLLFHLLAQLDCIEQMIFMLQKEVVERIVANPGSRDYGRLSVMLQYYCQADYLFSVGPGAFKPAPRVDSAIVQLTPHRPPPIQITDKTLFDQIVKQAFSQRRKTLRNSLREYLDSAAITAAGVDPGQRPERLSLSQFAALANAVAAPQNE